MSSSVSAFGKEVGLLHEVIVTGRKVGADRTFWSILAHDEEMFRKVVDLVNEKFMITKKFMITVDHNRALPDVIKAGNYSWVHSKITVEHFPVKGGGKHTVLIRLLHFYPEDDVISEMKKQGYRPATIEELLAFGERYHNPQKEFLILALGSVCMWEDPDNDDRRVAALGWDGSRYLDLHCFDPKGCGSYRYAAVHVSKS